MAEAAGETDVENKLCTDLGFAIKYGFRMIAEFWKGGWNHAQAPTDGEGGLDLDSIMMYGSRFAYDDPFCFADVAKCPMYQEVHGVPTIIERAESPSTRDGDFIRKFYRWRGYLS